MGQTLKPSGLTQGFVFHQKDNSDCFEKGATAGSDRGVIRGAG